MEFLEVTVTTSAEAEELVSDIFWDLTDYGVAISSVDEVIKLLDGGVIYDYYDKAILEGASGVSLVKGYFPLENAEKLTAELRIRLNELKNNSVISLGTLETVKRVVDGDDWITIWKKHFKPIKIGEVTVCPEWIKCDAEGIVIKLDSNLAFGTGEHETTSMVVEKMQPLISQGVSVIDVGTGSGILGIICALMGSKDVVMTDIDPVAVDVAIKNAKLNNVEGACKILCQGNLDEINRSFDLGVANITAEVLVLLSKQIASVIKADGHLVLSGILNDRVDVVENTFAALGFKRIDFKSVGEWSCLVLQKFC